MDPFELRRVELLHSPSTDEKRQWFVLNVKICGVRVSKFLSSSPLVARFPSEFSTVQLSDLRNGGSLDGRYVQDNKVAIASLSGVVSAILQQKFKEGEVEKYRWLIDAINSLEIGTETGNPWCIKHRCLIKYSIRKLRECRLFLTKKTWRRG